MTQALNLAFSVALIVTLWATAVGSGLSHLPAEVIAATGNRRRFTRLIVLDAVAMPLVIYALARALAVPEGYTAGLVLVGAASAGAIGLAIVRLAAGDMPLAIGLVVVLEAGNLITIPLWSTILLPDGVRPPLGDVAGTLVLGVLVPLLAGNALRALRPERAKTWAAMLATVSRWGLAITVAIIVALDVSVLVDAWTALVPIVALIAALCALAVGWVAGGPLQRSRATGALVMAVRANTPALAVASATYGATSQTSAAIVVFALVALVVAPVFAVWLRRIPAQVDEVPVVHA
jgi:bile acid:Na+ symporter, BASS family